MGTGFSVAKRYKSGGSVQKLQENEEKNEQQETRPNTEEKDKTVEEPTKDGETKSD